MTRRLQPGLLRGTVAAMPSKSDLHRLLIAAHLAGMDLCGVPMISEDIAATNDCLQALASTQTDEPLLIHCRESGSTLRFLLPLAAALGKACRFVGEGRLPQRPMAPLLELLRVQGCTIDREQLPFTIRGTLRPGVFSLPGDVSSQYLTGLLFALPLLPSESEIRLTSPLESAGYVHMTLQTLRRFGVLAEETPWGYRVAGKQVYRAAPPLAPEADWSNAAFWLAANALGSQIQVTGLPPCSAQPDRIVTDLLAQMGEPLHGIVMDASACPDLVPVMAVVLSLAANQSQIIRASRLRLKESDRLLAMAQNLRALGAHVTEQPDGLTFQGVSALRGGEVQSFNDHRIAMAMAVAATRCQEPLTLHGAEAVTKSYPAFWEDYERLKLKSSK